jgi:tetratricopeptide (TPR) repeat protein
MLSKESNRRVCARITWALEMITNERFDPLAFDAVASWWKQHSNKEEYAWPFKPDFDGMTGMSAGSLDEALIHFDRMINKEAHALLSLVFKGLILTEKGKYDEAEKVFKQVEDVDKNYRWLYVWRTTLFLKQNKQAEAVNSINRALEISPGIEEFIRSQPWAQPFLTNKAVKWSSQSTGSTKEEILQDQK